MRLDSTFVSPEAAQPLLQNRLDIHDRKQFEVKLEYQPSGKDPRSKYRVEMFMFLPGSLNIDAETYPRNDVYADLHNYVRLKTPVLRLDQLCVFDHSPLVRFEQLVKSFGLADPRRASPASDVVYQAKLLSCVFRGALRRFSQTVDEVCRGAGADGGAGGAPPFEHEVNQARKGTREMLAKFRALSQEIMAGAGVPERTRASLRLVDEYMSLSVEQFFRKAVADMERLPRTPLYVDLRKELLADVIREESYRKDNKLRSVISPTGDNEEYMHRIGFLKKFCMNILFLSARRDQTRKGWEEVLFAVAAGLAMAFAVLIGFWAQERFLQNSFNFFLILVIGYMMKDRIKDGLRGFFARFASKRLFDRSAAITDPVTKVRLGTCREKVDYFSLRAIPPEIWRLRQTDDFLTVTQGELSENVIRYQKQITLSPELLPKVAFGGTGVTDIIRFNVDRLLRDMDDPEYALEYVDQEDLTVGRVRAAKSYQVDLAFRFTVDDADQNRCSMQLVRLVLDRNGIKRMLRFDAQQAEAAPVRALA